MIDSRSLNPICLNTWIIADTHFEHPNINKYETIRLKQTYDNGFSSPDEMMFYRWNEQIKKDDVVLHLGDFAMKRLPDFTANLNGKLILIKGNHDSQKIVSPLYDIFDEFYLCDKIITSISTSPNKKQKQLLKRCDDLSKSMPLLCGIVCDIDSKRILFSHFPVYNDNQHDKKYSEVVSVLEKIYDTFKCDYNIHGHTHSYGAKEEFCISACVELNDFKPKRLKSFFK